MSKFHIFCILLGKLTLCGLIVMAAAGLYILTLMIKEYFRIKKEDKKRNAIRRNQSTTVKRTR